MNQTPEKFVFWKYALFPYTLGAPAVERPNGRWYVPSYQMTVKPLLVVEMSNGQAIAALLNELDKQRTAAQRALNTGFEARLRHIAPFACD